MIDLGHGVKLDSIRREDLDLLRRWRNDEKIFMWCRQTGLISELDQDAWFIRQSEDPKLQMFVVCKNRNYDRDIVGVCGLTDIDLISRRAEFSLYIAPEYQGQHFSKKALRTLFGWGFDSLNLNCIWGETFDGNPAADVFESLGMTKEGTRRQFYYKNGKYLDAHLYSILRSEAIK